MTVDPAAPPSGRPLRRAAGRVAITLGAAAVATHRAAHRLPTWLPADPARERRRAFFWLALLTLLAGVIRFYHLGRPCLWYDESKVFYRTCGTYAEMLDCLRTDGFVPLHYSLIWLMAHPLPLEPMLLQSVAATVLLGLVLLTIFAVCWKPFRWLAAVPLPLVVVPAVLSHLGHSPMPYWHTQQGRFVMLTPTLMRFVAAVSGTLTVPAVYFLARQLLPRGTSLLASLLAATSAFAVFYSRDAKMYPDAWLMVVLNAGCFFWWMRDRTATGWLCWVATGAAGVGLHATAGIVVGLSPLLLLSSSGLKWRTGLAWLAGVVLIFAGIVGYYENFNRWIDRIEADGWQRSELAWIKDYNRGRTGLDHVRVLATAVGYGWEWPTEPTIAALPRPRFVWPARAGITLLVVLTLATLPWPARWRRATGGPQPQWRVALWLSLWIVVPVYAFYCYSIPGFSSPAGWLHIAEDRLPPITASRPFQVGLAVLVSACVLVGAIRPRSRAFTGRTVALLLVTAAVLAACCGVYAVCSSLSTAAIEAGRPWQSVWVPRYLGFVWPAVVLAAAALLSRLPGRAARSLAVAAVVGCNLMFAALRILAPTEPPTDLMAADAFHAENPDHRTVSWTHTKLGTIGPGGGNLYSEPGEYYLQLLRNAPTTPTLFRQGPARRFNLVKSRPVPDIVPPETELLVIWDQTQIEPPDPSWQPLLDPPAIAGWVVSSTQTYPVRDCWTRLDLARYTRWVYVRTR